MLGIDPHEQQRARRLVVVLADKEGDDAVGRLPAHRVVNLLRVRAREMELALDELVGAGEQMRDGVLALHHDDRRRDMKQRGGHRAENECFHGLVFLPSHICHRAIAATMVYPSAIAQPPASVTSEKPGETSLVSHIPAKSSQGAANSSGMSARPRSEER